MFLKASPKKYKKRKDKIESERKNINIDASLSKHVNKLVFTFMLGALCSAFRLQISNKQTKTFDKKMKMSHASFFLLIFYGKTKKEAPGNK